MGYYSKRFWADESGVTPPAILSDGNTLQWYDCVDPLKVTKDGNNLVASVIDLSGNNRTMVVNSSGNKPLYSSNGILFDGVNDCLLSQCSPSQAMPITVYILFKQISWTSLDGIFDGYGSTMSLLQSTSSPTTRMFLPTGNSLFDSNLPIGAFGVKTCCFNGSTSFQRTNNLAKSTAIMASTYTWTGLTLGARAGATANNPSTSFSNIEVKEIIIRKVADTTQDETDIYNYLKSKYGL